MRNVCFASSLRETCGRLGEQRLIRSTLAAVLLQLNDVCVSVSICSSCCWVEVLFEESVCIGTDVFMHLSALSMHEERTEIM